jgi:hypothetical protein
VIRGRHFPFAGEGLIIGIGSDSFSAKIHANQSNAPFVFLKCKNGLKWALELPFDKLYDNGGLDALQGWNMLHLRVFHLYVSIAKFYIS